MLASHPVALRTRSIAYDLESSTVVPWVLLSWDLRAKMESISSSSGCELS